MKQPSDSVADDGTDAAESREPEGRQFASEVFLFLHAGGLPNVAVSRQLAALRCFGSPEASFDLDGALWSAVTASKADSFENYLTGLIDSSSDEGGMLSALIDYRDLLWLERRLIFQDQLGQRLRVVRLAFLDPALQAFRRVVARSPAGSQPGFTELARELVAIEEDEGSGDVFCRRHGLPSAKLWIEDLARPGVPALRGLLDRWSIPLPEDGRLAPIEPPALAELETVTAFRAEADRRHWSHALLPHRSRA